MNHSSGTVSRGITKRARALEMRRPVGDSIQHDRKMELLGHLVAGVSHDINNLLTLVLASLDLIEDVAKNGKIEQLAATARRAIDLSANLIGQLPSLSRHRRPSPALFNANELILEFHGLMRQACGRLCDIQLQIDPQLWQCHVDRSLLVTALLNLVLNGRDAMPNGGTLKLETRNVLLHERSKGAEPARAYVRMSVADTGSGISAEVRDRVFDPFFTTKETGKGTGLGLSMVHEFVQEAGGYIEIESASGAGTTVSLYLPKASACP
jgi:signal transduction histidine kinase